MIFFKIQRLIPPETDKRRLLKLADALESPKPEADRKMKEIEAEINNK